MRYLVPAAAGLAALAILLAGSVGAEAACVRVHHRVRCYADTLGVPQTGDRAGYRQNYPGGYQSGYTGVPQRPPVSGGGYVERLAPSAPSAPHNAPVNSRR